MRTAFFVYQGAEIDILTSEGDLVFEGMRAPAVSLCAGRPNSLRVVPGVDRIDSSHLLEIGGDRSKFDTANARKNNTPAVIAPPRAAS